MSSLQSAQFQDSCNTLGVVIQLKAEIRIDRIWNVVVECLRYVDSFLLFNVLICFRNVHRANSDGLQHKLVRGEWMTTCSSSETPTYSNWLWVASLLMGRIHKRKIQLRDCWKFSNLILDICPPASSFELSIWPPHTCDHSKRYMLVIVSLQAINTKGDLKGIIEG